MPSTIECPICFGTFDNHADRCEVGHLKELPAVPTIHLNGTSASSLIEQLESVTNAISMVEMAMREATPNARDYYVQQNPGAATIAIDQHRDRARRLLQIRGEVELIIMKINEQEEDRRMRRAR